MSKYKTLRKVVMIGFMTISASSIMYATLQLQLEAEKAKEALSQSKDLIDELREQADEDKATLAWSESERAKAVEYNKELSSKYLSSKKTTSAMSTKLKNMKKTNVVLENELKEIRAQLKAKK